MQLFFNNAETYLSGTIAIDAASMTIDDPDVLPIPSGGDFYLLTLTDGIDREIVRCDGGSGSARSITRAQEGSTAQAWLGGTKVACYLTAGTMNRAAIGIAVDGSIGADAVHLTQGTDTSGGALGDQSVTIGANTAALEDKATAVGSFCYAGAEESTAVGHSAYVESTGARASAIGHYAAAIAPDTLGLAGVPAVLNSAWNYDETLAAMRNGTAEWVFMSAPLDFTSTQTYTPTLPSGVTFYVNEVGLIVTDADTVTVQPSIRFGNAADDQKLLASVTTTGLTAASKRQRFTSLLSADGETDLTAKVTSAATATGLTCRFYWKGFAIVNEGI